MHEQLSGKRLCALARPPQRGLRITSRDWIDQLLQRKPHLWTLNLEGSLSRAAPNIDDVFAASSSPGLVASFPHRADRHTRSARHRGHTAVANRARLGARPKSTRSLVRGRLQQVLLLTNKVLGVHIKRRSFRRDRVDPLNALSRPPRARRPELIRSSVRRERHFADSFASVRSAIARIMLTRLQRCPSCLRPNSRNDRICACSAKGQQ